MMQEFGTQTTAALFATALVLACGNSSPAKSNSSQPASDAASADGGDVVTGTLMGAPFGAVTNAYWIGMPSAGSYPTQIFIAGGPLTCSAVSVALWDKALGNSPLLELGVNGTITNTYTIGTDADANYLPQAVGVFQATADSGTVTVSMVNTSTNVVGSFEAHFMGDTFKGTFDATYCATGVEP
jgi:hypothetical protein